MHSVPQPENMEHDCPLPVIAGGDGVAKGLPGSPEAREDLDIKPPVWVKASSRPFSNGCGPTTREV
jgi:hypothetical protein